MSIVEFLLARFDEDAAVALGRARRWGKQRMLADVDAKVRIVEKAQRADAAFAQQVNPVTSAASFALTEVLHYLALPYADHPDFDEAWKL